MEVLAALLVFSSLFWWPPHYSFVCEQVLAALLEFSSLFWWPPHYSFVLVQVLAALLVACGRGDDQENSGAATSLERSKKHSGRTSRLLATALSCS